MKIDVVYSWVDGSDPGYWELLRGYTSRPHDLNPERFRDHYQILRYSLRSLWQHGRAWLGRIFLVTARPQVPSWLKADSGLEVIHHDQFFDDCSVLPTFSNLPIESQLHRLPCSDPFLYFNDDYLLGTEVGLEQFLDRSNRIRVFGTLFGEHFPWHVRHGGYSLGFTEHTPLWIDKVFHECTNRYFQEIYRKTLTCKFRQNWNYRSERAYRYYLLAHTRQAVAVPFWQALKEASFHKITNDPQVQERQLSHLLSRPTPFICLNDDQGSQPHPQVVELVQSFLESSYPLPSPWEQPLP